MSKKIYKKKCKNCGEKFTPKYNSLEVACSIQCAVVLGKEKEKKKRDSEWRKKKKVMKEKLETKTDCEKKLEKWINTIVRELDKGHNCLCIDKPLVGKFDAGHLYSVGSNPQIRFHLFNIWGQSVHANQHKGGMPLEYVEGIERTFGEEMKEFCLALKGIGSLKLSKEELKEKTDIAKSIVKWLKLQDREFSMRERIELRIKFQEELGIYKE